MSIGSIFPPEVSGGSPEISSMFKEADVGNRHIRNVGWALGTYCDARCVHCHSREIRVAEAPLNGHEIDTIISKLADAGASTLNLGGNEPIFTDGPDFMKSQLPEVIR